MTLALIETPPMGLLQLSLSDQAPATAMADGHADRERRLRVGAHDPGRQ